MLPWGKIFMPFPVEARNLAVASIKCSLLPTSVAFLPSYVARYSKAIAPKQEHGDTNQSFHTCNLIGGSQVPCIVGRASSICLWALDSRRVA